MGQVKVFHLRVVVTVVHRIVPVPIVQVAHRIAAHHTAPQATRRQAVPFRVHTAAAATRQVHIQARLIRAAAVL